MTPRRDYEFHSTLSPHITGLINERRACGYAYNSAAAILKELDAFCVENGFCCGTVTKELADAWSVQRITEGLSARYMRVCTLRQVSKYIMSLGIAAYIPKIECSKETREAHVFTSEERAAFFESLDALEPTKRTDGNRILEECRVLFRLYYCCGMRLSEPLDMSMDDFDPATGILRIMHSKGDKDRTVWINPDIIGMLNRYRDYIRKECPGSQWLFPGAKPGKRLNEVTVRGYFLKAWGNTKYAGNSNPPTIKSFRHTFVVDRLNIWMDAGENAQERLPYLSKYLGHGRIDESLYYYHQVEESRKIIRSKDKTSDKVIPEVENHEK